MRLPFLVRPQLAAPDLLFYTLPSTVICRRFAMRIHFELRSIAITIGLLAAFGALRFGRHEVATHGGRVHLSSGGSRPITALVRGAGLGTRVMRLTPTGVDIAAHLHSGPLRVLALSLRPVELRATDVRYGVHNEHVAQVFARGHAMSLRADHRMAGVRTAF